MFVQGQFSHEERWDPNAIESIRALPWLWDTTKYDHEEVPHVKMDDPQNRDCEKREYGKMMGFDNREGRKKMYFQVTKKLIKEFGKTPGCSGCRHMGEGWRIHRRHDRECHLRIFHCMIQKHTLEGAKKLRITSLDWHERIRQLELILSNQGDQSYVDGGYLFGRISRTTR